MGSVEGRDGRLGLADHGVRCETTALALVTDGGADLTAPCDPVAISGTREGAELGEAPARRVAVMLRFE